tara:strand:- start:1191 stop:1505 length:315 start_codon:yes stop_codon:yes gene_type:complete
MGMTPPGGAPPQGGGNDQAPAAQILPIMAMLAQQQQGAMQQQQQQEQALKEAMRQQILRLVSMMPTENPAGMAARTEPMPTSMSPTDQNGDAEMESPDMGTEDY